MLIAIIGNKGCMPKGTMIMSPDGYAPIENASRVLSYNFASRRIEAKDADVLHAGSKQIIRLHTSLGVIDCSPEHRWIIARDGKLIFAMAENLKVTDMLIKVI
jgi:hypothetical protein